jgi:putative cell wall-binding protein
VLTRGGALALGATAALATPRPLSLRALGASVVDLEWLQDLPLLRTGALGQISEERQAPLAFSALGARAPAEATVRVRTADGDGAWSDWQALPRQLDEGPDRDSSEHSGVAPRAPAWVGAGRRLQLACDGADLGDVSVLVIDSVGLNGLASLTGSGRGLAWLGSGVGAPAAHAVAGPPIITRPEWGAAPAGAPRYADAVRFALVHHTVTSNDYTPGEAPGIVRAIQRYHMRGNGWRDIGYNFLVDRHGQIFEGRRGGMDRPVIGAQAAGFNAGSTGVALIGDHRSGGVTQAALSAVADLLAWLFDLHGIDPRATTVETSGGSTRYPHGARARFDTISGHRDASETSCPGQATYRQLDSVRDGVAVRLGEGRSSSAPSDSRLGRVGGQDAVATAVLVSRAAFDNGEADHAVVVNDQVWPDAATAGPLAGPQGPVMLTRPNELDERVNDELERVLPAGRTVYVLGGLTALSPAVASELGRRWDVRRVSGLSRTSTAAEAAEHVVDRTGSRTALVTRAGPDSAWSDTLAAGAYGARHGTPLLLTDSDRLSPATRRALRELDITHTIVIGGRSAVSDDVLQELPDPRRVAGSGRAGTAATVATELWDAVDGVVVASGYRATAWKDPLAAAPLAAKRNAPVALVDTDWLPPPTKHCLTALHRDGVGADDAVVVGGRGAVGDAVASRCARALG